MPLLPIDLQTLFAQMNQVGKEQAVQRDVSILQQSLQGSEIVKKTEHQDTSVNETKQVGEGLEKIKEEKKNAERRENKRKREREKKVRKTIGKNELFNDPDLGQHVDIVG